MKKLSFLTVLAFLALTVMVSAQVQSGKWSAKMGDTNYTLDKNSGERTITFEVNFDAPFDVKPQVMVSVTSYDGDKESNQRFNVEVLSVSRDGFTLKVQTWADSKINGIGGYWIAHSWIQN